MKKTWVLLLFLSCAGCREDSRQPAAIQAGSDAQSRPAQQRMHSLSVGGADAANSQSVPGNSRGPTVGGGATAAQSRGGSGNTQTMNVNASGGSVTQRQSGSGNSQSMNIGVVDGSSDQGGVARGNQ